MSEGNDTPVIEPKYFKFLTKTSEQPLSGDRLTEIGQKGWELKQTFCNQISRQGMFPCYEWHYIFVCETDEPVAEEEPETT